MSRRAGRPEPRAAVTGLLAAAGLTLAAPGRAPQDSAPRYTGALLACAVFREQVRTHIRSRRATVVVEDRAGRDGVLVLRATDSAGALVVEAWYDSLAVWRETAQGTERPDTDGFTGGRYRGVLSPEGAFQSTARPFVPDDLAALANLAVAFDDFLPRLPAAPLEPGGRWQDSAGLELRRLADGREEGERALRYRWTGTRRTEEPLAPDDSSEATVRQEATESGEMAWAPSRGPLAWHRRIDVEAAVPPRGGVSQPLLSTIRQEVWVTRAAEHPACAEPAGGGR